MRPVNVYRPLVTYLLAEAAEAAGTEALAVPFRVVRGNHVLRPFALHVWCAECAPVHVSIARLLVQRVGQFHACGQNKIAIDDGKVHVFTGAWQVGRLHFDDVDVFGVFSDVLFRRFQWVDAVFQLDPAQFVQHHQSTGKV